MASAYKAFQPDYSLQFNDDKKAVRPGTNFADYAAQASPAGSTAFCRQQASAGRFAIGRSPPRKDLADYVNAPSLFENITYGLQEP
jgi:hypothetical protein